MMKLFSLLARRGMSSAIDGRAFAVLAGDCGLCNLCVGIALAVFIGLFTLDLIFFSGDFDVAATIVPLFRGDRRRLECVLVAIRGRGARIALRSGNSSSEEYGDMMHDCLSS